MEQILALAIPLLSGAVGGNIIGRLAGSLNGGGLLNTVLGAVGGVGAGSILGALGGDVATGTEAAAAASNFDIGTLLAGVLGGAGGGAVLGGAGGFIKNMMSQS